MCVPLALDELCVQYCPQDAPTRFLYLMYFHLILHSVLHQGQQHTAAWHHWLEERKKKLPPPHIKSHWWGDAPASQVCVSGYCCHTLSVLSSVGLFYILYGKDTLIYTLIPQYISLKSAQEHLKKTLFICSISWVYNSFIPHSYIIISQTCESVGATHCTQLLFTYISPVCKGSPLQACNSLTPIFDPCVSTPLMINNYLHARSVMKTDHKECKGCDLIRFDLKLSAHVDFYFFSAECSISTCQPNCRWLVEDGRVIVCHHLV